MGQSEVLDIICDDGDILLSTDTHKGDNKYRILNNAIERYAGELRNFPEEETLVDNIVDFDMNYYPHLDLPNFSGDFVGVNSKRFSKRIQSWKGIVISQSEKTFVARLYDLNAGGTYEIGEFEKEDISPDDMNLFYDGAIFYWSVGYYMENGQSVKRSDIRFQRLITLDNEEFDETTRNIERKYSNLKERKIDNK